MRHVNWWRMYSVILRQCLPAMKNWRLFMKAVRIQLYLNFKNHRYHPDIEKFEFKIASWNLISFTLLVRIIPTHLKSFFEKLVMRLHFGKRFQSRIRFKINKFSKFQLIKCFYKKTDSFTTTSNQNEQKILLRTLCLS